MNGMLRSLSSPDTTVGRGLIYENVAQTIGNTPLVRLSQLTAAHNVNVELLGKLECFNPASSVKDRGALAMIDEMIETGEIDQNTRLVEATSGNNGIACAWICALKNIPLTIVMPEHMSIERRRMLALFGAELILTPKELGTKGAIDKAQEFVNGNNKSKLLGQFSNPANPAMHRNTTAQELWNDTGGQVDAIVAGVGTSGTLMGLAGFFKEHNPKAKIIAVEPASCPVLSEGRAGVHKIQGLSSGHVPDILDIGLIDEVITVTNEDAIATARELARIEGISAGISSGAAAWASLAVGGRLEMAGKTVATILADAADRYISSELFDGI